MKRKMVEELEIPAGVSCTVEDSKIVCTKDSNSSELVLDHPGVKASVKETLLVLQVDAGNRKEYKLIKSLSSHLQNIFYGLTTGFTYKLESANVHFPMTLKVESDSVVINNFLGEKTPRVAKIVSGANVDITGANITITSHDRRAAGQTAANLESATRLKSRDRRIFQDGIYIVEKPRRIIEENE